MYGLTELTGDRQGPAGLHVEGGGKAGGEGVGRRRLTDALVDTLPYFWDHSAAQVLCVICPLRSEQSQSCLPRIARCYRVHRPVHSCPRS